MFRQTMVVFILASTVLAAHAGEERYDNYFGHAAQTDKYGVIAPWYKGQNGQFDQRVQIAADTLKRYPWTPKGEHLTPAPEFIYNGHWNDVSPDGKIVVGEQTPWANGDLGQRNAFVLSSVIDYYRYSGDPSMLTIITLAADHLIDHCETPATHGWPRMLISVPTMGTSYGDCKLGQSDVLGKGEGKIQLDIVAQVGTELVRAYEMTGNTKWYEAAKHWADLMVQNRRHDPDQSPWGRYADNASGNGMNGIQTGGVSVLLTFFDELIRTGYTGHNGDLIAARNEGRAYLKNVLLSHWAQYDSWGRTFWDWEAPVEDRHVPERVSTYMMDHKDVFPNWKNDVRNILTLLILHNMANPESGGNDFNGAWAYPESSSCCQRSLFYATNAIAGVYSRYGMEANDPWALEIGRRSQILSTYDILPNGMSEDLVQGGSFVSRNWFKNAGPKALKDTLRTIEWVPEIAAPVRENHLVHSIGVVRRIRYEKGSITYETFDAPANDSDELRLAFVPQTVTADGKPLPHIHSTSGAGYWYKELPGGDALVFVHHPGMRNIVVRGNDPQNVIAASSLKGQGGWRMRQGSLEAKEKGASIEVNFVGNQVRVIGDGGTNGGLAEVYLDGIRQLTPIDCYSPASFSRQTLYSQSGLAQGQHTLRIVATGEHNPIATASSVRIAEVQYSAATGDVNFGEGGGPATEQRLLFGYTGRKDFIDGEGHAWRPGMEYVARTGKLTDVVAHTWWTMRQAVFVGTKPVSKPGRTADPDEELYRYGAHWNDFTVNLTVAPGIYHVRLKFSENEFHKANQRAINIEINGKRVATDFDALATAGGPEKAVDLVFNNIHPVDGTIAVRFFADKVEGQLHDAMVQALEVGPGDGGMGATPKSASPEALSAGCPSTKH